MQRSKAQLKNASVHGAWLQFYYYLWDKGPSNPRRVSPLSPCPIPISHPKKSQAPPQPPTPTQVPVSVLLLSTPPAPGPPVPVSSGGPLHYTTVL